MFQCLEMRNFVALRIDFQALVWDFNLVNDWLGFLSYWFVWGIIPRSWSAAGSPRCLGILGSVLVQGALSEATSSFGFPRIVVLVSGRRFLNRVSLEEF